MAARESFGWYWGLNDGHFPSGSKASAVLTDAEWEQVGSSGWAVTTAELKREYQRHRFSRQLGAASDSLTFLFSHRDPGGQHVGGIQLSGISGAPIWLPTRGPGARSPAAGRIGEKCPRLSVAETATPIFPRGLSLADIDLKRDLLAAMDPESGQPVALSPSAADTLMVSPFAWLLRRLGLRAQGVGHGCAGSHPCGHAGPRCVRKAFSRGPALDKKGSDF